MKPNEWTEGLNHIDSELVEEYVTQKEAFTKNKKPYWFAAVAAALVLAIGIGIFAGGNGIPGGTTGPTLLGSNPATDPTPSESDPTTGPSDPTIGPGDPTTGPSDPSTGQPDDFVTVPLTGLLAAPSYPKMAQYPNMDDFGDDWNAYDAAYSTWRKSQLEQYDQPKGYADSLTDFFLRSNREFLTGEGNLAYSPVNVYLAMAMLAETTDGNSRQQILDLFGVDTIENLRIQTNYLWNAHYSDDGQTTLRLANSLWLDNLYTFRQETVDRLASLYYASVFSDDLGTEGSNRQLRTWLNENTGGLLKEETQKIKFPELTCFALASTIYFKAGWQTEFSEERTVDDTFHTPAGNTTVSFMQNTVEGVCYYGSNFCAVRLELTGNNGMWIILPEEGVTVAQVLAGEEYLQLILNPNGWKNCRDANINIKLPKFDVTSQSDLIKGMKNLGLVDIFDPDLSDFTPMTTDSDRLFVSQINHAVRVTIDEKGVEAAAFTVIMAEDEASPSDQIDFVADRPFLFVISSRDNLPLFSGVVSEP